MIASEGVWFTLVYALLCFCIMAPPRELIDCGYTVTHLLKSIIPDEGTHFVQHHLHRTTVNTVIHPVLPVGYVFGLIAFGDLSMTELVPLEGNLWHVMLLATIIASYSARSIVKYMHSNFDDHSITKVLAAYTEPQEHHWSSVAARINAEFSLNDKLQCGGGITRTIVLRSWLIHTAYYDVQIIYIPDAKLKIISSSEHRVSHIDSTGLQSLTILVECRRAKVPPFTVQVNSLDYDQLKQRLPLENTKNIPIHRNLSDRFIEAFKSQVIQNPPLEVFEEAEMCIGCMQQEADVAVRRLCEVDLNFVVPRCTGCLCRPLWCSSCLARWFAARQDQASPQTWLNGKCPCPTCRERASSERRSPHNRVIRHIIGNLEAHFLR